jgi:3-oxoacyl-(acyl-carrier-protein) synthase
MGRAIRGALDDAGVRPRDVDLWFSSRDGVAEMDRAEAEAMRAVFADGLPREISVKDAIGEMAAAGGAQLVAACRALAGPAEDSHPPSRVLVNSFGAGGNFLAAVMESVP